MDFPLQVFPLIVRLGLTITRSHLLKKYWDSMKWTPKQLNTVMYHVCLLLLCMCVCVCVLYVVHVCV